MLSNSSSFVSSDRKEGPLFCGGRQSHHGALQGGGGGVGEDTGLQNQLVPGLKRRRGNKLIMNWHLVWQVCDWLAAWLQDQLLLLSVDMWMKIPGNCSFSVLDKPLPAEFNISYNVMGEGYNNCRVKHFALAFSFCSSFSGFTLCLMVLLPLGGSHVFIPATKLHHCYSVNDPIHQKNGFTFPQGKCF